MAPLANNKQSCHSIAPLTTGGQSPSPVLLLPPPPAISSRAACNSLLKSRAPSADGDPGGALSTMGGGPDGEGADLGVGMGFVGVGVEGVGFARCWQGEPGGGCEGWWD